MKTYFVVTIAANPNVGSLYDVINAKSKKAANELAKEKVLEYNYGYLDIPPEYRDDCWGKRSSAVVEELTIDKAVAVHEALYDKHPDYWDCDWMLGVDGIMQEYIWENSTCVIV